MKKWEFTGAKFVILCVIVGELVIWGSTNWTGVVGNYNYTGVILIGLIGGVAGFFAKNKK